MHFYLEISILQIVGTSSKFDITIFKKKLFYDTLLVDTLAYKILPCVRALDCRLDLLTTYRS
jgi:hypothetical protein